MKNHPSPFVMYSVMILAIVLIFAVFIMWFNMRPKMHDDVARPAKIDAELTRTDTGYNLTVTRVGHYPNSSLAYPIYWQVWNADRYGEMDSGILSNTTDRVWLNENISNGIIDVGDVIMVHDPAHSYKGVFLILYKGPIGDNRQILHILFEKRTPG